MNSRILIVAAMLLGGLLPLRAQNSILINNPSFSWGWQTGKIAEASLSVHPKGLYMEYGLYLTFSGSNTYFSSNDLLEVVMNFQLPKGAIVLDNWLWVGTDIVQGKLIDRWSASDIYEGIVNRRRDPSVLFKNSETQYELRVYPIKKLETRKVKITYLMPVNWLKGKIEAGLPAGIMLASAVTPDLNVFLWEEKGFENPVFSNAEILFEPKNDIEFGAYKQAIISPGKLSSNLILTMDAPGQNGIYLSVFEDENTSYYQMALAPGAFISQNEHKKILVLIDFEAGNSTVSKANLMAGLKKKLLDNYGPGDSFNLLYSKLRTEQAFVTWTPVTPANLDAALDPLVNESLYSNLPGIFASAFDFINNTGGQGAVFLVTNSDNFGNYEQANALIKDLKAIRNPLPPVYIADVQDLKLDYYYIGNRYYYGQEYLYLNLSKASSGYYKSIRDQASLPDLLTDVTGAIEGMITAFDLYTAPADGFCYGRFGTNDMEGFPVNQTVTQIGKFFGQTPFMVYLTGLYQSEPFSQLVQVELNQIFQADTMLAKMWHGRYIGSLEKAEKTNMIAQEILYESLNNRVLSLYSAFLCLEPSDTVSACTTCKDESRLVGIDGLLPMDSTGFVKLYPNPFRDKVTLEILPERISDARQVVVRIFNLTGQLVFEKREEAVPGQVVTTIWDGNATNGERVPAGQYIVMVQAGNAVWSQKLMKTE